MALKLVGEISLDGSGFSRGLQKAGQEANKFAGSSLGGIKSAIAGAFSVGAITALTQKTIEYAGHINDLADRLGVTTDYLQEMQFVAKQNGASVDELTASFEKLGAARLAALGGDVKAQQNFATLGVTMGDLQTKGTAGIMDTIAAQFKAFGNNDALKTAFKEIGGKGAGALVPSFIDGLQEGRAKAREAGAVISEDVLLQIDSIGDRFDQLKLRLMAEFAPAIVFVTDAIGNAVTNLRAYAAGLGALTSQVDFGKAAKANFSLKGILSGGSIGELARQLGAGSVGAGDAFNTQIDAGLKAQQRDQMERAAKIASRRNAANGFGGQNNFSPTGIKASRSDSLVSVGNFLGSSSGGIVSIAKQQLEVSRRQETLLTQIRKLLEKVNPTTIGVPPGS